MPNYLYRCTNGHELTARYPITSVPNIMKCGKCGDDMERKPQAHSFTMKG